MTAFDSKEYLDKVDAFWRAANFISVGQLYLKDNPFAATPNRGNRCETPSDRPLGNDLRTEFHLCPLEPRHQQI